jgi:tetratricopeptide (TPR) repeat protein
VRQCVADHDNFRAALRWFLASDDPDSAVRMALAIWPLLFTQALASDAEDAMEKALAAAGRLSPANQANARLVLGMMAFLRADYDRAKEVLPPARDRLAALGDTRGGATAEIALAVIDAPTDPACEARLVAAVDTFRRLDGDGWWLTFALLALGVARVTAHHVAESLPPLREGTGRARELADDVLVSNGLVCLGWAHVRLGDLTAADRELREALDMAVSFGSRETIPRVLDALAALVERTGDDDRAATLFGAAQGVRGTLGSPVWGIDQETHTETADHLRSRLGADAYRELTTRGAGLALSDVVATARAA